VILAPLALLLYMRAMATQPNSVTVLQTKPCGEKAAP
jgi:hypothetical protein